MDPDRIPNKDPAQQHAPVENSEPVHITQPIVKERKPVKKIVVLVIVAGIILIATILLGYVWLQSREDTSKSSVEPNSTQNDVSSSSIKDSPVEQTGNPGQIIENTEDAPKQESYQAVYLADGKIYFGKLSQNTDGGYTLARVFYINGGEYAGNGNLTYSQGANVSLSVLFRDTFGTEKLTLKKEEVTKWENMDNSSQIPQAINEYIRYGSP